jgi:hypothetical protein
MKRRLESLWWNIPVLALAYVPMMVAQNPVAIVLCANAVKQQDSQLQRRKIWTFVPVSL